MRPQKYPSQGNRIGHDDLRTPCNLQRVIFEAEILPRFHNGVLRRSVATTSTINATAAKAI